MPESQDPSLKFEKLRQQAEALILQRSDFAAKIPSDMLELIHELKIHQAELDIQNEELRSAQQELSELTHEFQNLYEFAPCGYLALNVKGIITRANFTAVSLLQTNRQFLLGSGLSQYISPGWDDVYLAARQKSGTTGQKQSVEFPLKSKNQISMWIQAEIIADRDNTCEVKQWRIVLLDITERKKVVSDLKRSETKYSEMMGSMKDAAYINSPELRIEYMNPRMISRVGRDATGEYCYKAVYGCDEKCTWCVLDQVLQGEHVDYELTHPGNNRFYSVTNAPVHHSSGTLSKLTIFRDITDRKSIEVQLNQSRKMESLGTMAGGVAHDFNNILYMITGNAELAMDDIPEWNPVHEYLKEIKSAGLRAAGIVKQILTFSRQTAQELKPIGAVMVIKDALKFMRSTIPATIEIRQNFPDKEVTILGDPTQINQVMMNLCINASQAMEKTSGVLDILIEKITLNERANDHNSDLTSGDWLKITVKDSGPGIRPDVIDRIFDPYFSTKDVGKGSGMGLAVVHGIIKNHQGTICVESKPGKGTTFTIFFPVVTQRPAMEVKASDVIPRGAGERVLFVDDEVSITNMTGKMLERLGYNVQTATSPVDALELFRLKPEAFDLVLTDMTMPKMTGVGLSEKLKEIRPDILVVICTGHSSLIDEEKARSIGINGYVMKPIMMRDIAKNIRNVLDEAKVPLKDQYPIPDLYWT